MNFLCRVKASDGSFPCNYDWLENFDVVITGRFLLRASITCKLLYYFPKRIGILEMTALYSVSLVSCVSHAVTAFIYC